MYMYMFVCKCNKLHHTLKWNIIVHSRFRVRSLCPSTILLAVIPPGMETHSPNAVNTNSTLCSFYREKLAKIVSLLYIFGYTGCAQQTIKLKGWDFITGVLLPHSSVPYPTCIHACFS